MSDNGNRPPPGRRGLPLVGETLAFARNPFGFIDERLAAHGRTFRTNVLGRESVVIAGPDAAGQFIDTADVIREDSMPPHIQELFGGQSLPLLDGDEHRQRKLAVMRGFSRPALSAYVPILEGRHRTGFRAVVGAGEFGWLAELKRLSIEAICTTVIGMTPGAEMDQLCRDYGVVTDGFATLPIRLPGTAYSEGAGGARSDPGRRWPLTCAPGAQRRPMTACRASSQPAPAGPAICRRARRARAAPHRDRRLHRLRRAGRTGAPPSRPPRCAPAAGRARSPRPPGRRCRWRRWPRMPYLAQVVDEVKRLCPVVPAIFGRARHDFEFDGFTIPAGWMVMWPVTPSHVAHGVYTNPAAFDPDRFSPERAEHTRHEHAFVPQGAGTPLGHKCPGLDFATCFMAVFAVVLLRGYNYELASGRSAMATGKTPPEPKDGLRATVTKNAAAT